MKVLSFYPCDRFEDAETALEYKGNYTYKIDRKFQGFDFPVDENINVVQSPVENFVEALEDDITDFFLNWGIEGTFEIEDV